MTAQTTLLRHWPPRTQTLPAAFPKPQASCHPPLSLQRPHPYPPSQVQGHTTFPLQGLSLDVIIIVLNIYCGPTKCYWIILINPRGNTWRQMQLLFSKCGNWGPGRIHNLPMFLLSDGGLQTPGTLVSLTSQQSLLLMVDEGGFNEKWTWKD